MWKVFEFGVENRLGTSCVERMMKVGYCKAALLLPSPLPPFYFSILLREFRFGISLCLDLNWAVQVTG